jgi:glycosyltransferase involved in cell wall biosynthesis
MKLMTRKKRILWVGEASFISTGYATYAREVLSRLHATGKYDIFELGCYGPWGDERASSLPWPYMTAMPRPGDDQDQQQYTAHPINQFGEWRFEEACLRHKPDCVLDIRDWWMVEFQERSPFRPFYHWAIMPTVDAAPQDEQWISTFTNADAVFTYTDWAQEVLRQQGRDKIKLKCPAPPGADTQVLAPVMDRRAHRRAIGVDEDCLIVGTVMRNQRRKLYPDLIQAFAKFLKTAPAELARKTYLYMHTSWPDIGWDIPRLLAEEGVGHRCLFTYVCSHCQASFPSFFADAKAVCRNCGQHQAAFPNSNAGISREGLASVINLFDVYVQYANSEGFGMPLVEAASCGVPVMAVDYSAMSDVVRKLQGIPINVQRYYRESETHCWRALPDNDHFVAELTYFLGLPSAVRQANGMQARQAVLRHYTYERTASIWETHLDGLEVRDDLWSAPARIHTPVTAVPANLSNDALVQWGIIHVAGRPELLHSYMALRMVRDLNWGATLPQMGGLYFNEASTLGTQARFQPFTRDQALQELLKLCEQKNYWETRRTSAGKP